VILGARDASFFCRFYGLFGDRVFYNLLNLSANRVGWQWFSLIKGRKDYWAKD
jgi:hypothetical protein